jgi:hypothetical protein
MPKENTHIWFAYNILGRFKEDVAARLVSTHIYEYLLGSFSPDTFFYSGHPEIEQISEVIHGKNNIPTNEVPIALIENAEHAGDIAFALGFLTHCALDIVMHPVIYYLTGNYYDDDPVKMSHSRYRHALFETGLDIKIRNSLRMHRLPFKKLFDCLTFPRYIASRFGSQKNLITGTLKKQLFANMLFSSNLGYLVLKPLIMTGKFGDPYILGLCYKEAGHSWQDIADSYSIRDIICGEEKNVTIEGLFRKAEAKALSMVDSAFEYSRGSISKKELLIAVPGENLGTGKIGHDINEIADTLF